MPLKARLSDSPAPEPHQSDLFQTATDDSAKSSRPAVRCWLLVDRDGRDNEAIRALSERRHLLVDAKTGLSALGDHDILLLLNYERSEIVCIGPAWLRGALPREFRQRGLAFWAPLRREMSIALFRPVQRAIACVAIDFRPGPTGAIRNACPNALVEAIVAELRVGGNAGARVQTASTWIDRLDPTVPDSLTGLLHFELGAVLLEASNAASESLLETAAAHFKRAARHLAASRLWGCLDSTERRLASVDEALFRLRQLEFAGLNSPTASCERAMRVPRLGFGIHRLVGIALPNLPLGKILTVPTLGKPCPLGRREVLCVVRMNRSSLREILPIADTSALTASVVFGRSQRWLRSCSAANVQRLGLGRPIPVAALLDGELHQLIGVTSRGNGAEVTVFADANGIEMSPIYKRGRVGYPVTFRATACESGVHSVRFTFLTHNRIVSRIQRTVNVVEV